MLYRVVCLLALCASTYSLSLGPQYVTRSHVARAGVVRAGLETLTEEAALALEGDELAAVATELSVYLFKSPPFQEKAEQPKHLQHGQSAPHGSAPARLLYLLGARLAALGSSALPGRGRPAGLPVTALDARASRPQSHRFHCV